MGKTKIELFEFDIDKVLEYGKNIKDFKQREKYFEEVLEIKKNNKTIIDHSIGDKKRNFVEEVRTEIEEINSAEIPGEKVFDKKESVDEGINRELENAHIIIKRQMRTIKAARYGLTESQLYAVIEKTRKKNGKANYSAIGREIGCTNHTAKTRCKDFNLK